MNHIKKYRRWIMPLLGGIAGYAYYYFISCASSACPIQSNPYYSTIYGALIGAVALFPEKKKKIKKKEQFNDELL
jgi:hypothetical protein